MTTDQGRVHNILSSGRRRRFIEGVIIGIAALGTAALLMRNEAMAAWFVLVFLLVLVASLMLLQARDKT